MMKEVDFLVIGTGIAGLTFALKAAEFGKVAVITKSSIDETNTRYAQGGIAAVTYSPDNFKKHIDDTVNAGAGYCDKKVVEVVVKEAPERIADLEKWGTNFDKDGDKYDLAKEGGHTEHRILHFKDKTGEEIQNSLVRNVLQNDNIKVYENHFAIEIITQHHLGKVVKRSEGGIECYGSFVFDMSTERIHRLLAKVTVMATGGTGNLYLTTTNPRIATGDGVAMAHRAKAVVENMEFIQFHPTALYNPGEQPVFLITEAIRGFGAKLRDRSGKQFVHRYDKRGELAPRDIVARAIDNEMKISGAECVYLDCRHIMEDELKSHFPNIYSKCLSIGIDITKDLIPVTPAAHYQCGGVKTDLHGQSSIDRLYAIGEVASTGLHGANRLASNSLIEAMVFAHRAVEHSSKRLADVTHCRKVSMWDNSGTSIPEEMILITQSYKEIQQILSNYVGIVRSDIRLKRALHRLEIIYNETEDLFKRSTVSIEICELRNLISAAYLTIKMAQHRHESIGLHYTTSYPLNKNGREF